MSRKRRSEGRSASPSRSPAPWVHPSLKAQPTDSLAACEPYFGSMLTFRFHLFSPRANRRREKAVYGLYLYGGTERTGVTSCACVPHSDICARADGNHHSRHIGGVVCGSKDRRQQCLLVVYIVNNIASRHMTWKHSLLVLVRVGAC